MLQNSDWFHDTPAKFSVLSYLDTVDNLQNHVRLLVPWAADQTAGFSFLNISFAISVKPNVFIWNCKAYSDATDLRNYYFP
jgi:hypothetical protein